jgi:hypothetical protein
MNTFDGLKYDCQGEGEFHVLKSLNSTFELQGRFVKFRDNARPTVTKSIVFTTGDGEPTVQITVPSSSRNGCTPYVYVNGEERDIIADGVGDPAVQAQKVETTGYVGYILFYHGSKVQLTAMAKKSTSNGCVLSAKICLPFDYERTQEKFVGLLGTPNDNKKDDWMTKDGGYLTIPTTSSGLRYEPAYNFCVNNWCIRDKTKSLFTYDSDAGESFEKFQKCGQAADTTTKTCATNPPDELKRICGSQNAACLIDGCIGGVEEAKKLIEAEEDLVDKMCGKQMFYEDFAKPMDGKWGEIYKKDDFSFLWLHDKSPVVNKVFNPPQFAEIVIIEFLFYEIGGWERSGNAKDYVYVTIGDTTVDMLSFGQEDNMDSFVHDVKNSISWTRRSISKSGNFGLGGDADQMHKFKFKIKQEQFADGSLEFKLRVAMSAGKDNESAGIDDFRVTAYGQSCVIPEDEKPKSLPPVPESLPVVCEERVATAWGDPHMVTFDGLKYDCQGEGEFTLVKSLNSNKESKFEVQGRFAGFDKRRITVTRALAIKEEGAPTVQLAVPNAYDKQCPISLFVNKVERDLYGGTQVDSVIVRKVGEEVIIYYPKTGLQFVVALTRSTKYGCYLSTKVCMPDDYRSGEDIIGLLGTPDDDSSNEWMKPDGQRIPVPVSSRYEEAYDYCVQNWCVRDKSKSLFAYKTGESFEGFNKCGAGYDNSLEVCIENPYDWLEDLCGSEDKRCIFEGCAGGEEAAKVALDSEFELNNEKGCGETVIYEDFNEDDASDWGMIETEPQSGQKFLGRFHKWSQPVSRTFDIPDFTYFVTMEFLLFEIDDWGAKDRRMNKFYVKINDKSFSLDTFEDEDDKFAPGNTKSGYKCGIKWKRQAITNSVSLGYNEKYRDQIHKVFVTVPRSHYKQGKMTVTFDVTLMDDINNVSAGVDELRITAHPRRCNDIKRKNCKKEGKKVAKRRHKEKQQAPPQHRRSYKKKTKRRKVKRNRGYHRDLEDENGAVDYEDEVYGEELDLEDETEAGSPVECRTAFAYHSAKLSDSFQDVLGLTDGFMYKDSDISWGWSNGPLAASNYAYSLDLYTAKTGGSVGKAIVEYADNEANVNVEAGEGLWLKDIKAYVGHLRVPMTAEGTMSVDPSQYPISHDRMSMSRSFTVNELGDKPIYTIIETEVCGDFESVDSAETAHGTRGGESSKWKIW